jgi:hypothetical protein
MTAPRKVCPHMPAIGGEPTWCYWLDFCNATRCFWCKWHQLPQKIAARKARRRGQHDLFEEKT